MGIERPVAWRWPVPKLRGVEWRYSRRQTRPAAQPLYSQDQIDAAVAAARERCAAYLDGAARMRELCAAAVRATPTHTWADGIDQWGQPCPVRVMTSREQYAQACERA